MSIKDLVMELSNITFENSESIPSGVFKQILDKTKEVYDKAESAENNSELYALKIANEELKKDKKRLGDYLDEHKELVRSFLIDEKTPKEVRMLYTTYTIKYHADKLNEILVKEEKDNQEKLNILFTKYDEYVMGELENTTDEELFRTMSYIRGDLNHMKLRSRGCRCLTKKYEVCKNDGKHLHLGMIYSCGRHRQKMTDILEVARYSFRDFEGIYEIRRQFICPRTGRNIRYWDLNSIAKVWNKLCYLFDGEEIDMTAELWRDDEEEEEEEEEDYDAMVHRLVDEHYS
jgi:hypothetical protein